MADDFLHQLRADWHGQDASFAAVHARLRRTRWQPHRVLALELTSAVATIAVGAWFAWVAVDRSSLLFAMAAVVLLLSAPGLAIATIVARRPSLRWEEETPASVLRTGMRRADASIRALRIARWHIAIILVFVVALWTTETTGLIQERRFLVLYSAVCLVSVLPYALWLRRRARRIAAERDACRRLLDDLEAEPRAP